MIDRERTSGPEPQDLQHEIKPIKRSITHVSLSVPSRSDDNPPGILCRLVNFGEVGMNLQLPSIIRPEHENGFVHAAQLANNYRFGDFLSDINQLGTFRRVAPDSKGKLWDVKRDFYAISCDVRYEQLKKLSAVIFSEESILSLVPSVFYRPIIKKAILTHFNFMRNGSYELFNEIHWDDTDPELGEVYKKYIDNNPRS